MSTRYTLARTLAGALAIAALAAPAALARPADLDTPAGDTAAQARSVQNLRSPDAEDRAARRDTGGATAEERYYSSYGQPASDQPPARPASADDGTPWTTIAASLAAALLILGGTATIAGRARLRTRRAGIAA
jgi:hypothetical protein